MPITRTSSTACADPSSPDPSAGGRRAPIARPAPRVGGAGPGYPASRRWASPPTRRETPCPREAGRRRRPTWPSRSRARETPPVDRRPEQGGMCPKIDPFPVGDVDPGRAVADNIALEHQVAVELGLSQVENPVIVARVSKAPAEITGIPEVADPSVVPGSLDQARHRLRPGRPLEPHAAAVRSLPGGIEPGDSLLTGEEPAPLALGEAPEEPPLRQVPGETPPAAGTARLASHRTHRADAPPAHGQGAPRRGPVARSDERITRPKRPPSPEPIEPVTARRAAELFRKGPV